MEMVDVPDLVRLEMNLGTPTEPQWQDVSAMSPGQAATALLALVMVGGSEPLIVDQPEEDLDNRFVFNEVVSQLTDTCDRRQVIVVTHDANIPVVGDAELVVALDAELHKGSILAAGGLENPEVARHARDILEGGQEAFDERMRRYPPTT
jgi:ABC-type cobalamin/Fe3+-siderophores transport system ATPase subunit